VELSVAFGQGRTGRVVLLVVAGLLLVATCCCLGGIFGQLTTGGNNSHVGGILGVLFAVAAAVPMTLLVIRTARVGAVLDGTRLTVTGLTSRTVDLRAATSVTLHAAANAQTAVASDGSVVAVPGNTRTPVLTVSADGRTVALRLRSLDGVLIPAFQMLALAGALDYAHCPGARESAGWLRAMAADPRTMLM
jgi:hypothetical protein